MKMSMRFALLAFAATSVHAAPDTPVDPEDWLYLSCGKGKWQCGVGYDIKAQAKETHEVRCCSDTAKPGWLKKGPCGNWNESDLIDLNDKPNQCIYAATYKQAQDICLKNNAYVCTKDQVDRKCAANSGCGHDADLIWTSTPAPAPEVDPVIPPAQPDDWYWLSCGRGKHQCGLGFDLQAQAKEKHELRCCSKNQKKNWLKGAGCDNWNDSELKPTADSSTMKCFDAVTFEEGRKICEANDGYICTKQEVDDRCAQGSGCQHDADLIWTSTKATAPQPNPHRVEVKDDTHLFLACGAGKNGCNGLDLGVAKADEKREVRCCSHHAVTNWMRGTGCTNYHESEVWNVAKTSQQCFHDVTFEEAQDICEANHGYVCTREEVINRCAQGSGCQHDADLIWTSTVASPDAVAALMARMAQTKAIAEVCTAAKGRVWGDPHFITFDNLKYDCQGYGEYVIAASKGSDPLAIHGRFVRRMLNKAEPTVTSAVAIKVVEEVPIIHVSVPDAKVNGKCPFTFSMGNNEQPIPQNDIISYFNNNFNGQVSVYSNGRSMIFVYPASNTRVQVTGGGGGRCVINTDLCLTPGKHGGANNIVGLLGTPNGNKKDDFMNKDGTTTLLEDTSKRNANKVGKPWCKVNWCVGEASKSMWKADTHAKFNQCPGTPAAPPETPPEDDDDDDDLPDPEVVLACKDLESPEECVTDTENEIEDGGDLTEFISTLVKEEKESKLVENLGKGDAEKELDGWEGKVPEISMTNAAAITMPEDFKPSDPADFGGGLPDLNASKKSEGNTSPAGSLGDPHFKTWKNEHFEYHGQCDLVLVKDHEFADGLGIEVQIRTKLVRFWSYIKQAAIRIGDDILEVEGSADNEDRDTHYWFNFERRGETSSIGGFPLKITSNKSHKRTFEIDLGSKFPGQSIVLSVYREFVRVDFKGSTVESFGNAVGMLGDFKTGDLLARDGKTEITDFHELGNEWQLLPSDDMLFRAKAEPQFPRRCLLPEDPQGQRRRRLSESTISVEEAEAACAKTLSDALDIKDCVYDILATQNLDMVGAF